MKKAGLSQAKIDYLCQMRILLVDNYDSFTWNLYHYLDQFVRRVDVLRNDEPGCLCQGAYDGVVVSPGPGLPADAGYSLQVIESAAGKMPLLGVCLGMQALAEFYGGTLKNLERVLHGRQCTTTLCVPTDPLFRGVTGTFSTGHYHSWVVDHHTLPKQLVPLAYDEFGNLMAIRHRNLPVWGVQFHPESVLTPSGLTIIENWVREVSETKVNKHKLEI
jgi:anthranilate synthase component II